MKDVRYIETNKNGTFQLSKWEILNKNYLIVLFSFGGKPTMYYQEYTTKVDADTDFEVWDSDDCNFVVNYHISLSN